MAEAGAEEGVRVRMLAEMRAFERRQLLLTIHRRLLVCRSFFAWVQEARGGDNGLSGAGSGGGGGERWKEEGGGGNSPLEGMSGRVWVDLGATLPDGSPRRVHFDQEGNGEEGESREYSRVGEEGGEGEGGGGKGGCGEGGGGIAKSKGRLLDKWLVKLKNKRGREGGPPAPGSMDSTI